MKKSEFIDLVAEKAEMSKAAAARVVDAIFDTASGAISEAVRTAGQLSIPGFGKFSSKTRAAREGRNPRTGVAIQIPQRTTVSFSPGKGFKESMAGEGGGGRRGAAKKSRTAGSARKAAGGAAKTRAGGAAAERATAKKSAGGAAKKSAPAAKAAAKKSGAATPAAKKTGGTKSAKR